MQTLTENLLEQGLGNKVLTQAQLERALGVSAAARYGLVNRALKADELVQIRRGLYVLAPRLRSEPVHPFALAQAIVHGSYISFETALSDHGWIPESVAVVASVVPGRKSLALDHPTLGGFSFHPLALNRIGFLEAVERRQFGSQAALVAKPLRALLDLVALRKLQWQGLEFVTEGLRIDSQTLASLSRDDFASLEHVYKQRRPNAFLSLLAEALQL